MHCLCSWEQVLSFFLPWFHLIMLYVFAQQFKLTNTFAGFILQEAFGKYLDMHELYNQFNNLKFEKPIEYSTYLDIFSQPHKIPRKVKFTRYSFSPTPPSWIFFWIYFKLMIRCYIHLHLYLTWNFLSKLMFVFVSIFCRQYKEYMENLLEYLAYFFQRTEPLQDLDRILSKVCLYDFSPAFFFSFQFLKFFSSWCL